MTETEVELSFPWDACHERADGRGVVVVLPRDRLAELRNFLWALEAGVVTSRGLGEFSAEG